jgi:hypothetical protein
MFDGTDTIVLFDELAYEDVLSVAWRDRPTGFSDAAAARLAERNLRLLQAFEALDEYGTGDKADETAPHSAELARLDFKLNLLLDLVGQLVCASHPRPVALPVRFNSLGASWQPAEAPPAVGAAGFLQIFLSEALVQPLTLPAKVVTVADSSPVRARFELLGEAVADQLEKLVFRRHRRKIAGARSPRR